MSVFDPTQIIRVATSNGFFTTVGLIEVWAYDASDRLEYHGLAKGGSATSAAVWYIERWSYTGTSVQPDDKLLADGNANFDNIWDDRASLSYS